jgi:phage-related holin
MVIFIVWELLVLVTARVVWLGQPALTVCVFVVIVIEVIHSILKEGRWVRIPRRRGWREVETTKGVKIFTLGERHASA